MVNGDGQTAVTGENADTDGGRGVLTGVTLALESGRESQPTPTASMPFISNESDGNENSNESDENMCSCAGELEICIVVCLEFCIDTTFVPFMTLVINGPPMLVW